MPRGAAFCKWRAVLRISADGCRSEACACVEDTRGLAAMPAVQDEAVPIVEPKSPMVGDPISPPPPCGKVLRTVLSPLGSTECSWERAPAQALDEPRPAPTAPSAPTPSKWPYFACAPLMRQRAPRRAAILFLSADWRVGASVTSRHQWPAAAGAPWPGFLLRPAAAAFMPSRVEGLRSGRRSGGPAGPAARPTAPLPRGVLVPGSNPQYDAGSLCLVGELRY